MAVEITSREDLENWLNDKPRLLGQLIAARAALRVIPIAVNKLNWQDGNVSVELSLSLFRAAAVSWSAVSFISIEQDKVWLTANESYAALAKDTPVFANAEIAAVRAAASIRASAYSASGSTDALDASVSATSRAGLAIHTVKGDRSAFWSEVEMECQNLNGDWATLLIARLPLWRSKQNWWHEIWVTASQWLSAPREGFQIWREWYYGRLEGLPHAFDRFDDKADEQFYRWIVEQDNNWWSREPAIVNADIKAFVDSLRKPTSESEEALLPTTAELEQNLRAIAFTAEDNGQVGLGQDRDVEGVDHSDAAQDRHAEVLEEARNALEACRPNVTQATDTEGPLERYLNALGEDTHGISPALLIARGEKLRRLIAARADDFASAIPFSEDQEGALEDWLTAHNLLVGLDPYLSSIERTARGPDAVPTVLDLEALKAVIESSQADNIPNAEASQALDDIAENVPPDAAPTDRRMIQATEAMKNFIRGVGAVVKKHGWTAVKATGGGAYLAALWVQRNIDWLRELFVNEPSILSILEKIASLPL